MRSLRGSGARSVEDDIGSKTGTTVVRARRQVATSKRLGSQPGTNDALRLGFVSGEQALEVSDAVEASPGSEAELLQSARGEPFHQLRKRAAAAKAAADTDREATRRRLHSQRSMRRWNDAEGMGNLLLKLPADEMAEIDTTSYTGSADVAGASGGDPDGSSGADLPGRSGSGGSSLARRRTQAVRPDKKVIAVIDVAALNRGSVVGDEQCEIAGVGPVSVSAVRRFFGDAFLAVVIKDGVEIRNVTHLDRQVTAHQRTALEARGGVCEFCGSTFRVEIDHVEGWALTHTTHVDDLSHKCWHCHDLKTRFGLTESGPPGNRTLLKPDGTQFRNQDSDRPLRRSARPDE